MKRTAPKNVDDYIERYPKDVQAVLRKLRAVIRKAAPEAAETISYQIPAYKLGRDLVYLAAFTDHISFFPTSSGVSKFKKELRDYRTSKGTIQFPLDRPIPYGLVMRITKFRRKEVMEKKKKPRTPGV
jgi:uncharacterized protein YdhG (YjbR/CyaY superfamily)